MSLFARIPTPNARLLYTSRSVRELEQWQAALNCVEADIHGDLRLEEANSSIYLYFFSPSSEWSEGEIYWVGREIIGAVTEKSGDTAIRDLEQGSCDRMRLGSFPPDWSRLLEREKSLREEYTHSPTKTWRIVFESEEPGEIFLEFFVKSGGSLSFGA